MFAAGKSNNVAASAANYIEDVFSTYLYTGTGANQTITNNIDLSTKGGMVWIKDRTLGNMSHLWFDSLRGVGNFIRSNQTSAQTSASDTLTSFNTNGFSLGADSGTWGSNISGSSIASWTFRKQAKFFDIVTYTGTNAAQTISHNLGCQPGAIIIKDTSNTSNWYVTVRDGTSGSNFTYTAFSYNAGLNLTAAASVTGAGYQSLGWITSTGFAINSLNATNTVNDPNNYNDTGKTYVAYLFASNAGGFGSAGTDNVITCGSYSGNGSASGPTITLGYEPQWVMIKRTDSTGNWWMVDTMRGMSQTDSLDLQANAATEELSDSASYARPLATGFSPGTSYGGVNASGGTYIYIAIRRGPMKTPTTGTSVFSPLARAGNSTQTAVGSTSFPPDLFFTRARNAVNDTYLSDRLRGNTVYLATDYNFSESDLGASPIVSFNQNGWTVPAGYAFVNQTGTNYIDYFMGRAPSFCDEVCYTGTGSNTTQTHNLGVVPQLIIVKSRSASTTNWQVYSASLANTEYLVFNATDAKATGTDRWNSTTPTSSVFSLGTNSTVNGSGSTYVAWLFATCAGVSKVGSYTGTGATQTIDCGFTSGARFVMIKKTNAVGDWLFWDTARGMVSGTDPRSAFNLSDAETNANWVYTTSTGFQIVTNNTAVNANGSSYIFLAIA